MFRSRLGASVATCALVLCAGCGGNKAEEGHREPTKSAKAAPLVASGSAPALRPLPMGKSDLAGYAYSLGRARRTFQPIKAAEKRSDWSRAEAVCRATLMADPGHLSAHWHLALSLARQGRYAEVAAPLSAAVAGDWMRWGQRSLEARALAGFLASPDGARYRVLAGQYRAAYRRVLADGMLLVGRRGKPWLPRVPGNTLINHRSEIYAYDVTRGRYLRVSRTNASLVGFLRAPAAPQLAYVSYRRVWVPSDAERKAGARPYLRRVRIGTVELGALRMSRREIELRDVASVALWYATDKKGRPRLLAWVESAKPAPGASRRRLLRLDVARAAATPLVVDGIPVADETLVVSYRAAELQRARVRGVRADWGDDASAGALRIASSHKTITFPAGESAWRDSLTWSTGRTRIAVSTRPVAPCSKDPGERTVKLYVIDVASAKLRPIAVGEGDFAPAWIDDGRLAYVDTSRAEPAVRIVDVTTGTEIARLETSGGLGTQRLPTPLACRSPDRDDGSDDEEDDDGDDVTGPVPSAPTSPVTTPAPKKSESDSPPSSTGAGPKLDTRADAGENTP